MPSSERAIVLRFRDLITVPGRTILEHSALIERFGFCWWGWWRKPYEVVPHKLLIEVAEKKPLMFLMDSGSTAGAFAFYRVELDSVAVTPTATDIPSPDVAATPRYYNAARFAVWFRFSAIARESDSTIGSVTVRDLPTWPNIAEPEMGGLTGTVYRSQVDLRRLDVTLWDVDVNLSA